MTDLEMIKKCAEKMGVNKKLCELPVYSTKRPYDPLHDDAQAMALVKKFHSHISIWDKLEGRDAGWWRVDSQDGSITCRDADLNRAIVECVAKL